MMIIARHNRCDVIIAAAGFLAPEGQKLEEAP